MHPVIYIYVYLYVFPTSSMYNINIHINKWTNKITDTHIRVYIYIWVRGYTPHQPLLSPRKAAVKREPTMARAPMVMAPMARSMATAADPQKVQKRATWLNANVFPDRPIDQEAGHGPMGVAVWCGVSLGHPKKKRWWGCARNTTMVIRGSLKFVALIPQYPGGQQRKHELRQHVLGTFVGCVCKLQCIILWYGLWSIFWAWNSQTWSSIW